MKKILDRDDKITCLLSTSMDMMLLNLVFIVCCIPAVSIGAASTAMYSTMSKRKKDVTAPVKIFCSQLRLNFKSSTICWVTELLIILASAALFKISVDRYSQQLGLWLVVEWVSVFVLIVSVVVGSVIFPLISRYENNVKMYIKNACLFTMAFPLYILLNLLLLLIPVFILVFYQGLFLRIGVIFPLFGFSLLFFLSEKIFSRMFISFEKLSSESTTVDSQ